MAAKDTQILIELKDTVPQFTFGKDVTARDITLSRARMVRAYRMFLRGIVKPIDAKKDLEERQLQLAEAKQREADDAERRRIAYEEQRERDNGKTDTRNHKEDDRNEKLPEDPIQKEAERKAMLPKHTVKSLKPSDNNPTNEVSNATGTNESGTNESGTNGEADGTGSAERGTKGAVGSNKF